eukprot:scpid108078/ scgid15365/ 
MSYHQHLLVLLSILQTLTTHKSRFCLFAKDGVRAELDDGIQECLEELLDHMGRGHGHSDLSGLADRVTTTDCRSVAPSPCVDRLEIITSRIYLPLFAAVGKPALLSTKIRCTPVAVILDHHFGLSIGFLHYWFVYCHTYSDKVIVHISCSSRQGGEDKGPRWCLPVRLS